MVGSAQPVALIVENEAALCLLTDDLLTAEGFDTVFADDEDDAAFQALAAGQIAVAVVSLRLHGALAGRRVIQRLRQHAPGLPVVVMTGYDKKAPQADLRGVGGPTVRLHKPGAYEELAPVSLAVIDRARRGEAPMYGRRRDDIT
ncbi:response regulator [Paracraurococcus ruber]|uniref:Response regulatory domain-containing protein n=1 Tax=Paracraurococcus ruber TaxID=77675 RepID=A0ABS1D6G1_9PROT|nr:hypothetical protein [Paracraurococcus ruber]TDG28905.1 response regulator [Paracraurococcus ruber]